MDSIQVYRTEPFWWACPKDWVTNKIQKQPRIGVVLTCRTCGHRVEVAAIEHSSRHDE